jgi:DNA-binding NarL/FixJ family response regulator
MALSWVARQHGKARLTVVTIADIAADTPGLSGHLSSDDSVTHSRANSADVVSSWPQSTPCVLVADVSCVPSINLARIRTATDSGRSVRTLIVVDEDDPELCERLLRMGFDGAIERSAPPAIFRRALHAVAEGELWAPRKSISALLREFLSDTGPTKLTTREREIFDLLAKGHKNREIADALFVSRDTIRWHLRSIYAKVGAPDRKRPSNTHSANRVPHVANLKLPRE